MCGVDVAWQARNRGVAHVRKVVVIANKITKVLKAMLSGYRSRDVCASRHFNSPRRMPVAWSMLVVVCYRIAQK